MSTCVLLVVKPILAEFWLIPVAVILFLLYRQFSRFCPKVAAPGVSHRLLNRAAIPVERRKEFRDEEDEGSRRNTEEEQAGRRYLRAFPDLSTIPKVQSLEAGERIKRDRELFWKLQNLESHSDAIDLARTRISELFDQTLYSACRSGEPILSINQFSSTALKNVLDSAHSSSTSRYEAYLTRRKSGGPRELFPTMQHAKEWIRLAAVVKYVDGGWISSISHETSGTTFHDDPTRRRNTSRQSAKMAWQVISEEFGDGDLEKNHIYMYHALMDQLGLGARQADGSAMPGHLRGFDGLKEDEGVERCWTAAIAQQCIGILSTELFPEALGFNMAYETLPYHLLVTSRELRELDIDDTYFALHITIDNPDSGHAALGRLAVERYLEGVLSRDGHEALDLAWKRVQAGFVLADGLPTTPWSPIEFEQCPNNGTWRPIVSSPKPQISVPTPTETEMATLMQRKAVAAEKMHCPSKMSIKKRTLEQWLDPGSLTEEKAVEFVRAMADTKVMVKKGDVEGSRFFKEMAWGGRMFGAFSRGEVEVVRRWIEELGRTEQGIAYQEFTGRALMQTPISRPAPSHTKFRKTHLGSQLSRPYSFTLSNYLSAPVPSLPKTSTSFIPLWLTSLTLLESFPLAPAKLATQFGMSALRIIRSQQGFASLHQTQDICAGLDEFGMEHQHDVAGLWEVAEAIAGEELVLEDQLKSESLPTTTREHCRELLAWRNKPYENQSSLVGLTLGFARTLHRQAWVTECLKESGNDALREILQRIVQEEEDAIHECMDYQLMIMEGERRAEYLKDFFGGYQAALSIVREAQ